MNSFQTPRFPESIAHFLSALDRLVMGVAVRPQNTLVLVLLLLFALNGFRSTETNYFFISQSPFEPFLGAAYVQDAIFLPLSAYLLGFNQSQIQFDLYSLSAYLAALLLLLVWGRKVRPEAPLFLGWTLAVSPVSLAVLAWPGMPDAFTVLFSVLAVFSSSVPLLFAAALLGVTNHPMFLFIAPSLGILRLTAREKEFKLIQAAALALGALAGFGLTQAFLSYHQMRIEPHRLQLMFEPGVSYWLEFKLIELPLSLFSLYRGLWFVLPVCFLYGFSRHKPYYITLLAIQFSAAVLTFFVLDTTRVFSLLTIGAILHGVAFTFHSIEDEYRPSLRWLLTLISGASVFLPNYLMMMGQMYMPPTALLPYLMFSAFLGQ